MDADFYLALGEAALVLRNDGKIEVKAFDHSAFNKNIVTCLGLAAALDNAEWRKKLEARALEKYAPVLERYGSIDAGED